jgi:hypothetical protein
MLALVLVLGATAIQTTTRYDDDRDEYITSGQIRLDVPFDTLTRVAGELSQYRHWALDGINGSGERDFITLLRDIRFRPRGVVGLGIFTLHFDVDLVWPFGSKNNLIHFKVAQYVHAPGGGAQELRVILYGENVMIDDFRVRLYARPDGAGSLVKFHSVTRFDSFFDTFLSMARYKRNVEWRIVKVIKNLKKHVESLPKNVQNAELAAPASSKAATTNRSILPTAK